MKVFKVYSESVYLVLEVDDEIFKSIPEKLRISHSSSDIAFMCANEEEIKFVESLGVSTEDESMDYFQILRSKK